MSSLPSRRAIAQKVSAQILANRAEAPAIMKSLAAYLVDNHKAHEAEMIMNDIAEELMKQAGLLSVEVISARPLTDTVRSHIIDYLKKTTGAADIDLRESIDENLLGGFIARTASGEIDASIRTKLRQLTALA